MFSKYRITETYSGKSLLIEKRHGWLFPVWEAVAFIEIVKYNDVDYYGTMSSISDIINEEKSKENGVYIEWEKLGVETNKSKNNTPLSEDNIDYLKENKREKPADNLKSEFINDNPYISDNYAEQFNGLVNNEKINPSIVALDGKVMTDKEEIQEWMDEINKEEPIIRSSKDLRFKKDLTKEQLEDLYFNIYEDPINLPSGLTREEKRKHIIDSSKGKGIVYSPAPTDEEMTDFLSKEPTEEVKQKIIDIINNNKDILK